MGLFDDQIDEDANKDYLAELVGEGKKFKSVEDLAKGKAESDRFIVTLTRELEEARTEIQKRTGLEELKTAILNREQTNGNPNGGQPTVEQEKPVVDANSIEELVLKKLDERDATKSRASNEALVTETLTNIWGDNAQNELRRVSNDVGMSISELKELGQRNPKALFKLIGVGNQPQTPNGGTVPRSSIHVETTNGSERNYSYYQKLKTSDPKTYFDKRTQIQMNKDALRLKDRFYS